MLKSSNGRLKIDTAHVRRLEAATGYKFPRNLEQARAIMNDPAYTNIASATPEYNPAVKEMVTAYFQLAAGGEVYDSSAQTGQQQREAREGTQFATPTDMRAGEPHWEDEQPTALGTPAPASHMFRGE